MVFYYLEVIYHVVFVDESVLLDLKHLLLEAKQKIPPVLAALQADNEEYLELGGKIKKRPKPSVFLSSVLYSDYYFCLSR